MACPFTESELQQTLTNLRGRYPEATRDDARTLLQDAVWAEQDEQRWEAEAAADRDAELEFAALA